MPTWVLADPDQWAQVRDRLHELVVKPVAGYGGGERWSAGRARPPSWPRWRPRWPRRRYRFVAQEPVEATTVPTLVDGALQPRRVGPAGVLRRRTGGRPARCRAPLDPAWRSAAGRGSKDTWLLG